MKKLSLIKITLITIISIAAYSCTGSHSVNNNTSNDYILMDEEGYTLSMGFGDQFNIGDTLYVDGEVLVVLEKVK